MVTVQGQHSVADANTRTCLVLQGRNHCIAVDPRLTIVDQVTLQVHKNYSYLCIQAASITPTAAVVVWV